MLIIPQNLENVSPRKLHSLHSKPQTFLTHRQRRMHEIMFYGVAASAALSVCDAFTHIPQGCITGNGESVRLSQCQWSNTTWHL